MTVIASITVPAKGSGYADYAKAVADALVAAAATLVLNVNVVGPAAVNVNITGSTTLNVNLTGSTIMMPVDIQAQLANININIAASAVTLNINISSQSAFNMNVNIAAAAATLNVNITGSTTIMVTISGTADIQITGQNVGVYIQESWAAEQAEDKNFFFTYDCTAVYGNQQEMYIVPAGKIYKIIQVGCTVTWGGGGTARSGNMALRLGKQLVAAPFTYTYLAVSGGGKGCTITFAVPIIVAAGYRIQIYVEETTTGAAAGYFIYWMRGYEVNVP